jgi:hypothetical protein
MHRSKNPSFDYLIGAHEQRGWHVNVEHFGRLQIDEQLGLRGLLNWKFSGLLALENAAGVDALCCKTRLPFTAGLACELDIEQTSLNDRV